MDPNVALQALPASSDSLRRALEEVFARPEYEWLARPGMFDWLRELWYRLLDGLATLQAAHPAGFRLLLVGLIVVLALLVAHVAYVVWRITRPTAHTPRGRAPREGPRLADGPAHRARAEQLARLGRYAEALAHLFVALLLDLERAKAVRFHPSKTPAEYLGEARLGPSGRASLADVVGRLYRHVFGAVPCDEAAYREFAAATDGVFRHVAPA